MRRKASAVWEGNFKEGKGKLFSESGLLDEAPYTFKSRFGNDPETNPEELIAAAHSGCFSMALAHELGQLGLTPEKLHTEAEVELQQQDGKWTVTDIKLKLDAVVPEAHQVTFYAAAERARQNCPISRLFNARITLDALLQQNEFSAESPDVMVYTSTYCPVCSQVKSLLETKGIEYQEIDLDLEPPEAAERIKKRTGHSSVPIVFVGDQYIGDYQDLLTLDRDRRLETLIKPKDLAPDRSRHANPAP